MLIERIRSYLGHGIPEPRNQEQAERRSTRRIVVNLAATIFPVDIFADAQIHDVSETGARGEADVELAVDQPLHITADEVHYYRAIVRWTRDRQFGLELPDSEAIFGKQSDDIDHGISEGHLPRAPRLRINARVRLVGGRPPRQAIVRNLSADGMLLETSPTLGAGQHMVVRIGNTPPIYGRAQWSRDGKIGVKAQNKIDLAPITSLRE